MKISYQFPLQSTQVQVTRILECLSRWIKGNDNAAINLMYWVEQLMFDALERVTEKTRLQHTLAN